MGVTAPSGKTLTITDDEDAPAVTLVLRPASIAEDGEVSTVTATLDRASSAATTVAVSAAPVSPALAGDYTLSGSALVIAAGQTTSTGTVTITANDNSVDAADKKVTVSAVATNSQGITAPGDLILTITDDDAASTTVTLTVAPDAVNEDAGAAVTLTVTGTLNAGTRTTATVVTLAVENGTAQSADYTATGATLTIAAKQTNASATLTVTPVNDAVAEGVETLSVGGTVTVNGLTVTPATVTIIDDEGVPTVTLLLTPAVIGENGGSSTVTAALSSVSSKATTVTVSAAPMAALAGDFTLSANRILTIAAGSTSSTGAVTITAADNDVDAPDKTVTVSATAANDVGVMAPSGKTLTITDDEAAPAVTLVLRPASIAEDGEVSTVTATLDRASSEATTVAVSAAPVSPALAADFTLSGSALVIAAGQTTSTGTVTITANDNSVDAADKKVTVSAVATNSQGITAPGDLILTITDDDAASTRVTLTVAPDAVNENAGAAVTLTVTGTLNAGTRTTATVVTLAVENGTAQSADYTATGATLTIAAKQTNASATLTVTPVNDAVAEGVETLSVGGTVTVSGLTVTAATVTLIDDEGTPTVTLLLTPASIAEDGGVSTVTAALSSVSSKATTVTVSAAPMAPALAADFSLSVNRTLTIAAGQTSSTGAVTITAADNDVDADDKTVTVSATADNDVGVTAPSGKTLTITDDDDTSTTVTLTVAPAQVDEDGGAKTLTVTGTLNAGTRTTATVVTLAVENGTAQSADYTAAGATLTIAAKQASATATLSLTPANDAVAEGPETVRIGGTVTVSGLTVTAATVTLIDDESAPTVTLVLSNNSIAENGGSSTVSAELSGASVADTVVTVAAAPVPPAATADFTLSANKTLTIAAGTTKSAGLVTLTANDNTVDAPDKTVTVSATVVNDAGVTDPSSETLAITDDDDTSTKVTLTVEPDEIAEDEDKAVTLIVTGTLDAGARTTVTEVTLAVTAVTAAVTDDFILNGEIKGMIIEAGQHSAMEEVTLTPVDDALAEGPETISIGGTVTGLTVTAAVVTILDDEGAPMVTLELSNDSIVENGGSSEVVAKLSNASSDDTVVTVAVALVPPAAAADFTLSANRTLTIAAGTTKSTGTVTISANDNTVDAPDKTVTVSATVVNDAGVTDPSNKTLTITDDEDAPTVTLVLTPASIRESDDPNEEGGQHVSTVTATLDHASSAATTVTVSAAPVLPAVAGDYTLSTGKTLTIAVGATTSSGAVTITAVDNSVSAADKDVTVSAAAANGQGITAPEDQTLSISDDDGLDLDLDLDLSLSGITIDTSAGSPTDYIAVTDLASTTVTATARDDGSSVLIELEDCDDDTVGPQKTIPLSVGENTINITVTPTTGEVETYSVTVTRVAPAAARWPMENNANDVIGELHGVLSGDASFVTTDVDVREGSAALSLDGTDDWVDLSEHAASFTLGSSARSVAGWFKADAGSQGQSFFVYGANYGDGQKFAITADRTEVSVGVEGHKWGVDNLGLSANWHHVAVTYEAGGESNTIRIYLDGVLQNVATLSGSSQTVDTQLGTHVGVGRREDGGEFYGGIIDDLRLYDHALTAEEVEQLIRFLDDDVTLTVAPDEVDENAGAAVTLTVTGTLNAGTRTAATEVALAVNAGTATLTDDYTATGATLTIVAGQSSASATLTVTPVDDTVAEGPETVSIGGSVTGLTVTAATVTLIDDEGTPTVTLVLTPASIRESDNTDTAGISEHVSTVTATLFNVSSEATVVTVAATPALAADYTLSTNKTLTIAAGATTSTGTVTITAVDNSVDAPDKTATVSATAANDAGVTDPSDQTLTITDDEDTPTVTLVLTPASIRESDNTETVGDQHVSTVTATLDHASSAATTVTVSAAPVSPALAVDYTLGGSALIIAAGATTSTGTVTLTAVDNSVDAADKEVTVSAMAANGQGITAPGDQTLTISDDDGFDLSLSGITIDTSAGSPTDYIAVTDLASTTVTARDDGSSVLIELEDCDDDTVGPQKTIPLSVGENTINITVTPTTGEVETYSVTVTRVAPAAARWPMENNANDVIGELHGVLSGDASFVTTDVDVREGSAALSLDGTDDWVDLSEHAASFTLGSSARSVAGWFKADAGSQGQSFFVYGANYGDGQKFAITADRTEVSVGVEGHKWGVDNLGLSANWHHVAVTYEAGGESNTIRIYLDGVLQNVATLSGSSQTVDTQLGTHVGVGRREDGGEFYGGIIDDLRLYDHALTAEEVEQLIRFLDDDVTLTVAPDEVDENAGAAVTLTVTGTLNAGTRTAATEVALAVNAGTATLTDDYTATGATLTIVAGQSSASATLTVTPVDDTVAEGPETVSIGGSVTGLTVTAATVTLIDDEGTPTVTLVLTPASIRESDNTDTAGISEHVSTVTATLFNVSSEATVVTVAATPALAADYTLSTNKTLTIAAGATTSTGTVTITAVDNSVDAPDKTATVSATAANDAGVTDPSDQTLTITDDEDTPTVTLVLTPASIRESDNTETVGDQHVSTVTATLDHASSAATTVTVSAAPVSPALAVDYTLGGSALIIAAGATTSTGTVTLTAVDNSVDAADKEVTVSAMAANGQGITAPGDQTLTISDDDGFDLSLSGITIDTSAGSPTDYIAVTDLASTTVTARDDGSSVLIELEDCDDDTVGPQKTIPLSVGENTINITVTPTTGEAETYSVTVTRVAPAAARWPMENNANDVVGESHGALMGEANFVTTDVNVREGSAALSLDGTDDWVDLSEHGASFPLGSSARSLASWFKADAGSQGQSFFVYGANYGDGQKFAITADRTEVSVSVEGHKWGVNNLGLGGGWHHVAVTYAAGGDSDTFRIYLDGVLRNAATLSGSSQTVDTQLGTHAGVGRKDGGAFYGGIIDDLRLYDHALTQAEVTALSVGGPGSDVSDVVVLTVAPDEVNEDAGAAVTLTVTGELNAGTRDMDTEMPLTLGGTAMPPGDYTFTPAPPLTIAAGQRSGTLTLTLTPVDDALAEGPETIVIGATVAGLTVTPAVVAILDNETLQRSVALAKRVNAIGITDTAEEGQTYLASVTRSSDERVKDAQSFALDQSNTSPSGLWSDRDTLWVADWEERKLFAYRLPEGEWLPERDIAVEGAPMGLWSDGETIWVVNHYGGLQAYRLSDGGRVADRDLELADSVAPVGVWSDGATVWVSEWLGRTVKAYLLADGSRVPSRDIVVDDAAKTLLAAGLWADGSTLWLADWSVDRIRALGMSDGRLEAGRSVATAAAGYANPVGLWSDGAKLWVTAWNGERVHVHALPRAPALGAAAGVPLEAGEAPRLDASGPLLSDHTEVNIADAALRGRILAALGKAPDQPVSAGEMAALRALNLRHAGVADLSGLEMAVNLVELDLGFSPAPGLSPLPALASLNLDGASLANLAPLSGLTGLSRLSLRDNAIVELAPLAGLTGLKRLDLGGNRIVNLQPLSGLTSLSHLSLRNNVIVELAPLAELTRLKRLDLGGNRIVNLQPLSGLTELTALRADGNRISDISALAPLTQLTQLDLSDNRIRYLHALSGMQRLEILKLASNELLQVYPLSGLEGLKTLVLRGNLIEELQALSYLGELQSLDVRGNRIAELYPLFGLRSLVWLDVRNNRIEDFASPGSLTALIILGNAEQHREISN